MRPCPGHLRNAAALPVELCNLYSTYELAQLIAQRPDKHITVSSLNPGAMSDTGFARPSGNSVARADVAVIGAVSQPVSALFQERDKDAAELGSVVLVDLSPHGRELGREGIERLGLHCAP